MIRRDTVFWTTTTSLSLITIDYHLYRWIGTYFSLDQLKLIPLIQRNNVWLTGYDFSLFCVFITLSTLVGFFFRSTYWASVWTIWSFVCVLILSFLSPYYTINKGALLFLVSILHCLLGFILRRPLSPQVLEPIAYTLALMFSLSAISTLLLSFTLPLCLLLTAVSLQFLFKV